MGYHTTNSVWGGVTHADELKGWTIERFFEAEVAGFQTGYFDPVRVDWSVGGAGTMMDNLSKWTNTLDTQEPIESDAPPSSSTVKIKVEDKRPGWEGTAENSYSIKWHTPYEQWKAVGSPDETTSSPAYFKADKDEYKRSVNTSITGKFLADGPYAGDWSWVGTAVEFGNLFTLGKGDFLYKFFLFAAGTGASIPTDESFNTSWDEVWAKCKPDGVSDAQKEEYKLTKLSATAIHKRQAFTGDSYGTQGYQGEINNYSQTFLKLKCSARPVLIQPDTPRPR